jgi:hypothetical protein
VREQEISLQQGELIRRNTRLRQDPESGVDAVRRIARADDLVDQRGGGRPPAATRTRSAAAKRSTDARW